nr:hypothetical protein [Tanacetum cinerariifolium]
MARQCPKPKRKRDATWFRDKVLLVEAQGNGKVLNEEELEFLADPKIVEAKAVLMANLSSYGSDVLFEVPHSENTRTDMLNQKLMLDNHYEIAVRLRSCDKAFETHQQEMSYSEQTHFVNYPKNEITSDSNIILYSHYLLETQNAAVHDTNSSTQQDAMILFMFEQLSNQKVKELDNIVCKIGQSTKTVHMLTKPQVFYDNNQKQALGFQIPFYLKKAWQIRPMLYDGNVIAKEINVISIDGSEETLMLEEEI